MFRRDMPEINEGLTPDSIPFDSACRKHGLFTVSRQKDPQGGAVYMINIGVWTKDVCSMNDFFKVCTLHLEQLILDEEAQIKGVVAILNLKGLGVEHLTQYTPSVIRKLFDIVQGFVVMRIKAIYIINNPAAFDVLFSIAKLFLKSKVLQRTHILGYDTKKQREVLPDDLIPEKDGGSFESYDYDLMKRELQGRKQFFEEISRCGYRNVERNPVSAVPTVDDMTDSEMTHM
ncbi:retinaldehyde-binding protein 1-like [Haemaphysalis longicornis]